MFPTKHVSIFNYFSILWGHRSFGISGSCTLNFLQYSIQYTGPVKDHCGRCTLHIAHCTTDEPIPLHCISYTYFTVSKMQSLPIHCSIKSIYIYINVMLLGQLYKSRTRSSWHDTPSMDANSIVANECKWTHQDHLYLILL